MTVRSLSRSFASSLSPETRRVIILALVAAAIMAPNLVWGIPSNNDLSNHFRFGQPERATVNLQIREPSRARLSSVVSIISWTLMTSFLIFGSFVSQRRRARAN